MISGIVGAVKLGRDKERRDRRRARKEELAAKKKLGLLRESAGIPGNRTPALRESGFSAVEELRLLNTRLREDVFEVRSSGDVSIDPFHREANSRLAQAHFNQPGKRVHVQSSLSSASPITSRPTRSALRFSSQPSLDTQSSTEPPQIGNWSPPLSHDRHPEFSERGRARARPPPSLGGRKTFSNGVASPQQQQRQQQQQQQLVYPRAIHPSHSGKRSPVLFRAASLDRSPLMGSSTSAAAPASPGKRGPTTDPSSIRPVSPSPSLLRKRSPSPSLAHLDRSAVLAAVQLSWQELAHTSQQQRADPEIVLAAVTQCANAMHYAAASLLHDKTFVLKAVTQQGGALRYASPHLREDREVVLAAVAQNWESLEHAHESLRGDATVLLCAVAHSASALKFATPSLLQSRRFMLACVSKQWRALHFAPKHLRADPEVVLAGLSQSAHVLEWASIRLKSDFEFMATAVQLKSRALPYASPELLKDRTFVLAAAAATGFSALRHAPLELRDDKGVMLACVQKHWYALHHAPVVMRDDEEIMLACIAQASQAMRYASMRLQRDLAFCLGAVKINGSCIAYITTANRTRRDVCLAACAQDGCALEHVPEALRADTEVVLTALCQNGFALKHANAACCEDRELVLFAVRNCGSALQFVSWDLQNDASVVLAAVEQDGNALEWATAKLQHDRCIVLAAVHQDWHALKWAHECLRADPEIVLAAVQQYGDALQHAAPSCRGDKAVVLAAVKNDGNALEWASEELQDDKDVVLQAVTEDRNALNFASKRQRRDVDVVVASLLGASKHNNDSDGPVHNHSYQNESSHNITLSPVSIHKSNPHDHDTSASDVQVRIMVSRLADAKEDAIEQAHLQSAENARLQEENRRLREQQHSNAFSSGPPSVAVDSFYDNDNNDDDFSLGCPSSMHPSHRCSDDSSEEDGTSGEEDTHVSSRSVRTQSVHEERSARSDILESTSSSFAHVVPSKTVSISSTAVSNKGVAESGTSAQLPRKINVGDRIEVQDIGDAEWYEGVVESHETDAEGIVSPRVKVDGYESAFMYDSCRHLVSSHANRTQSVNDDNYDVSVASSQAKTSRSGASHDDTSSRRANTQQSGSDRIKRSTSRTSEQSSRSLGKSSVAKVVYSIGDVVECRDNADDKWERGVVEALDDDDGIVRPLVRKDGYETGYTWEQVRHLPRTNQFRSQSSSFYSIAESSVSTVDFGAEYYPASWADDASARRGQNALNARIGASKRGLTSGAGDAIYKNSSNLPLFHEDNDNQDKTENYMQQIKLFIEQDGSKALELFGMFDKAKCGLVEHRELCAVMILMGIESTTILDAKRIVESSHGNGGGKFNYTELLKSLGVELARDEVDHGNAAIDDGNDEEEKVSVVESKENEENSVRDEVDGEVVSDDDDDESNEVEESSIGVEVDARDGEAENESVEPVEEKDGASIHSSKASDDAQSAERFTVGARVQALFEGGDEWFRGEIVQVHDEGTYDIAYDDGDEEEEVSADLIRFEQDGTDNDNDEEESHESEHRGDQGEVDHGSEDENSTVVSELTEVEVPKSPIVPVDTKPKNRQCREEYTFGQTLGEGAFSVVKKATRNSDGKVFAVKCIHRTKLSKIEEDNLQREIEIMREIKHPHVIGLVEVFENDPKEIFLVQEYVAGGELFDRLQDKTVYSEAQARVVVHLLLSTLAHLHAHHVVHRDLKPENILMVSENDDTNIMLCDFGFAKHIIDLQGDRTLCGTPDYVAPEILMRQPYGASVDIWSAGIITYTLLGGYPPFYDDSDNHNKLFRKIIKGNFVFDAPFWDPVSAEAKDLIQQMLTLEPSKRPSAADLLHHPWVADASNPTKKGASEADLTGAVERLKKWQAKRRLQGAMKTVRAVTRLQNATHSPEEEGETEEEEEESETSVSPLKNTTTSISVEESPVKEESVPAKVEAPVSTTNEEPEEEVVDDVDTIESSVSSEPPPPAPPLQGAQVTAFVSPVSAPRSPKKIPKKRFLGVTSRVRRTSESIERPIDKGTGGIQPERHEEEVKMSSGTDLEESVDASVHDSKDEGELKEEEGASDDDVDSDIAFDDVIALPAPAQKERRSLLSKLVGTGYLKLTAEQRQQQKLESKERKKTEAARKKAEKAAHKEAKRNERQTLVEQKAREKLMTPDERLHLKLTRMALQKEEKARIKEEKEALRELKRKEKESRLQHKKLEEEAKSEEKERQQSVLRRLSGASSTPSVASATREGEGNRSSNEAASDFHEMDGKTFANMQAEKERAARVAEEREQKRLAAAGVVLAANHQARLAREAQWRAEEAVRSEERQVDRMQAEADAQEARERRRMRETEAIQAKLEQALAAAEAAAAEAEALARAKERQRLEQLHREAEQRVSSARAYNESGARYQQPFGDDDYSEALPATPSTSRRNELTSYESLREKVPTPREGRRRAPGQRQTSASVQPVNHEVGADGLTAEERERWDVAAAEQEAARQRRIRERAMRDQQLDHDIYNEVL